MSLIFPQEIKFTSWCIDPMCYSHNYKNHQILPLNPLPNETERLFTFPFTLRCALASPLSTCSLIPPHSLFTRLCFVSMCRTRRRKQLEEYLINRNTYMYYRMSQTEHTDCRQRRLEDPQQFQQSKRIKSTRAEGSPQRK
ncbi:hypothetical protein B9Z55_021389 [Caenorhabditis nigoni]|uniref:Uncharacterized protein n=1 Tax=Caenorhabditis nigoni TaxID=1611254 RepID=A0A2G5TRX3_9PELO|nr:hypothetical protein B9Z55_021389 [Caenorhabditis nigoni]